MDTASIYSREAALLACYPRPQGCYSRLSLLRGLGIERVCTRGPTALPGGVGALGKGHSSTVFAALLDGARVAVKSRRPDGRRASLEGEARLLLEASRAGAAPGVYGWGSDFIVMEYLGGPSFAEVLEWYGGPPGWAVGALLEAAATLDLAGVLHHELHRPWWNVFYTLQPRPWALVIDFDSASAGCGNLAKVASALVHLGVVRVDPGLRGALGWYKKDCGVASVARVLGLLYEAAGLG